MHLILRTCSYTLYVVRLSHLLVCMCVCVCVCVCVSHSLSVSRAADHPWIAVGLQPGSLFEPQGNKTVHLYNWQEGKVHQIFDAGTVYYELYRYTPTHTTYVFILHLFAGRGGLSVSVHTNFSPCGR